MDNGRPLELEAFQRTMLTDYFAGTRETVVLISKKNGKSTTLGALALFHLVTTPDAECLIAAASRDQATILYDQAAGFVKRSPGLQERVVVKRGYREIRGVNGGRIRVLAADADTADGVIPTLALVDELHRHKSAALYGVFRDGLGPRSGRMVTISTAGDDEDSPLGELRAAARTLPVCEREGAYRYCRTEDRAFAMHEWALDPGQDRDDMALVKDANPASWHTLESLRERHDSPSTRGWQWARFACGVWLRGDLERWISPEQWGAVEVAGEIPAHADVVLGFDGSFNGDATAIVAVELGDVPRVQVVRCWERTALDPEDWTVPVEDVEDEIRAAARRWRVREIAADTYRWQRSMEILSRERLPVVEFPQRPARMIPATTRFYEAVVNGGLVHDGNQDLARHVGNAVLRTSSQGAQLSKDSKGSTRRIDLAVAAVMAFDRAQHYRPRQPRIVNLAHALAQAEA